MKLEIFLFFCTTFFSMCFSQVKPIDSSYLECKYQIVFLKDSIDVSSKKDEIMTLQIGENVSLFRSDLKQISDSISRKIVSESILKSVGGRVTPNLSGVPRTNFHQEVYKKNGKATVFDRILKYVYAFEPINQCNWILVNEIKTINRYVCKKAITSYGNRNLTAWYTEQIPISEGPYNFKGLPGLIVEVYDNKDTYHFTLVGLKNVGSPFSVRIKSSNFC